MFREDIFDKWLNNESEKVQLKLEKDEALTQDDKLIVLIKQQSNHIFHLDIDLRKEIEDLRTEVKIDISNLREEFNGKFDALRIEIKEEMKYLHARIDSQTWKLLGGMSLLMGLFLALLKIINFVG